MKKSEVTHYLFLIRLYVIFITRGNECDKKYFIVLFLSCRIFHRSMARASNKTACVKCEKDRVAYECKGCSQNFCFNHLAEHRQELAKLFDDLENERNLFRYTLSEQTIHSMKHILFEQINQWESNAIDKIKQAANETRELFIKHMNEHIEKMEIKFKKLTEEIKQFRQYNDFNEINLDELKVKLKELEKQLNQPSNITIQEDSSSFINKISLLIFTSNYLISILNKIDLEKTYFNS